jgi:rhodanese-related sulfurtransferase
LPSSCRAFLLILIAGLLLVGCSTPAATPATSATDVPSAIRTVTASEAVAMLGDRVIIDVRTPEEFAAGHLAAAVNIPVEATDFDASIEALDRAGAYLLYCRSGRRSAMAADIMAQAGFTDVVDAGGLELLVAAGAPLA